MSVAVGEETTISQTSFKHRRRQLEADQRSAEEAAARAKELESKSPFKSFTQFNKPNMVHIRSMIDANPNAAIVFMFLAEHMDKMNAVVCSYQVLQEQLNIGRTTLSKAVKYLREKGFLYVYKSGISNVYCLNPNLVWSNHGDKVKYCKFPANVLLSASEQDEIDQSNGMQFTFAKTLQEKDT